MHKLAFDIRSSGLDGQLRGQVGSELELSRDLTVTDRVEVAKTSLEPIVFVLTSLPDVMQVAGLSSGHSFLRPNEITPESIRSIANGLQVFSHVNHHDLQLDEETWRLVGYVAHGQTQAQACDLTGYSLRTAQRVLHRLVKKSRVQDTFGWALLKPIFPSMEELEG